VPVCKTCEKKIGYLDVIQGDCFDCHFAKDDAAKRAREEQSQLSQSEQTELLKKEALRAASIAAILLTTESAPPFQITQRLEIITAECVLGINIFKDIGSALRDVFGGRNEGYQKELRKARKAALHELRCEAFDLGADAVIGVSLSYSEISGGGKSMLLLVASGTAVRLADLPVTD
jgi:uncharacterized protein YbjQ (UPF0145 family)